MRKHEAMAATRGDACSCWDAATKLKAAFVGAEPRPCPEHDTGRRQEAIEEARRDAYLAAAEEARANAAEAAPAPNSPTLAEQVKQAFHANAGTDLDDDTPPAA